MLDYDLVGRRLREMRRQRGLSQAELAERADLSSPYISHIETGLKKPSLDSLIRISDVLETSVDQIICSDKHVDTQARDIEGLLQGCNKMEKRIVLATSIALINTLRELDG